MKDDLEFMERITRDLEARKAACRILEVAEVADEDQLKKAYRRAATKYHPDHNQEDPEANRKFALVKCAYQLLSDDKPCENILEEICSWTDTAENEKYSLDNPWGHFLWWREKLKSSSAEYWICRHGRVSAIL